MYYYVASTTASRCVVMVTTDAHVLHAPIPFTQISVHVETPFVRRLVILLGRLRPNRFRARVCCHFGPRVCSAVCAGLSP